MACRRWFGQGDLDDKGPGSRPLEWLRGWAELAWRGSGVLWPGYCLPQMPRVGT